MTTLTASRTNFFLGYMYHPHENPDRGAVLDRREPSSRSKPIFDQAALATVRAEEPSLFRWESAVATAGALLLLIGYSIVAQRRRAK